MNSSDWIPNNCDSTKIMCGLSPSQLLKPVTDYALPQINSLAAIMAGCLLAYLFIKGVSRV